MREAEVDGVAPGARKPPVPASAVLLLPPPPLLASADGGSGCSADTRLRLRLLGGGSGRSASKGCAGELRALVRVWRVSCAPSLGDAAAAGDPRVAIRPADAAGAAGGDAMNAPRALRDVDGRLALGCS